MLYASETFRIQREGCALCATLNHLFAIFYPTMPRWLCDGVTFLSSEHSLESRPRATFIAVAIFVLHFSPFTFPPMSLRCKFHKLLIHVARNFVIVLRRVIRRKLSCLGRPSVKNLCCSLLVREARNFRSRWPTNELLERRGVNWFVAFYFPIASKFSPVHSCSLNCLTITREKDFRRSNFIHFANIKRTKGSLRVVTASRN